MEDVMKIDSEHSASDNSSVRPTLKEKIIKYFQVDAWSNLIDDTFDWDKVQGFFLIPITLPDQRMIFYCILNQDGVSNKKQSVKQILKSWLNKIEEYNENINEQDFVIAGNDFSNLFLDEWGTFICKNVDPVVVKKKETYKPSVLEEEISFV